MDSETAPQSPVMPRNKAFEPARGELSADRASSSMPAVMSASTVDGSDRNGVFAHLVREDGDIAGLVAYSIYKQNKLDWLRAFEGVTGRAPGENELASYIIGEGTPRRLATYRHLAEATLAGNGPEVGGAPSPGARQTPVRRRGRSSGEGFAAATIALYAFVAVLFVVGFYLALHFTATTR